MFVGARQKLLCLQAVVSPRTSIRARLAVWYAGLLLVVLLLVAPATYMLQAREDFREIDSYLRNTAHHLAGELARGTFTPEVVRHHETPLELLGGSAVFVTVFGPDRALLAASDNAHRFLAAQAMEAHALLENTAALVDRPGPGGRIRLFALPVWQEDQLLGYVQLGAPLAELDAAHARLRGLLLVVALSGFGVALAGGWLIASSALGPVTHMARAAQAMAQARSLAGRLPAAGTGDELDRLAATFNSMLESLEQAYEQQRRFIDDASHELRAPLTTLRGNLDLLLRSSDRLPAKEKQAVFADMQDEIERLIRLVNDLLFLARTDHGQPYEPVPVELDRIVLAVHHQFLPVAQGRELVIDSIRPVTVAGQPDHIRQLVTALVDNAVKYTPAPGVIGLSVDVQGEWAVLTVRDTGVGIAAEELPHIFRRFHRADLARRRHHGGTGLGLAICQAIVEEHGGEISVASTLGEGTSFAVKLPFVNTA